MQDIFGSVRRSLVFRQSSHRDSGAGGGGAVAGIADRVGSCLRKSRVGLAGLGLGFLPRLQPLPAPSLMAPPPPPAEDSAPAIRWRKGELIGCGAFGHVYMGMNLDSGELLAVKQVLIGKSHASKEKAQDNIRELEEEVKLLKNLSHPNIVVSIRRYLGTAREEDTLNILLEFVPGGSISSLLGKFGSFPEAVIRMYTKQLLQGLEYLHQNGIIHRDIKVHFSLYISSNIFLFSQLSFPMRKYESFQGANILVDNKGCIKLADFGASKQVAKLATMNAAKSMKGTPYWMAPEVIVQTGHSFSADIWSVGCTVIEMATGKPPWSQQYQEVAVLYHIGTTKSHPPIPEHLSPQAKDFLLKCLQKYSPFLLHSLHPFVTGEYQDTHPVYRSSVTVSLSLCRHGFCSSKLTIFSHHKFTDEDFGDESSSPYNENLFSSRPIWEMNNSDDMCQLDDNSHSIATRQSFNPMSEPLDDDWPRKFDTSPDQRRLESDDFTFPCGPTCEDDDEVTETKIRAFLDEKALELKKLQTPLYEEFHSSMNASNSNNIVGNLSEERTNNPKLPPKIKSSPSRGGTGISSAQIDPVNSASPGRRISGVGNDNSRILREIPSPRLNELEELVEEAEQKPNGPSDSFSERRRKWKEELDRELESQREMMRQAGVGGRTSSPKDKFLNKKRDWTKLASPGN
ncbi:hypothetical protein Taro_010634 [Colocasia esculenta]|uniref:mitogen-activated protein kinase kinase kinase n=1 Tax=Colocasia esculenta TaxID=4460 RepID=A0A843U8T6_COLES|nr:hypothetical protein [Colocasia esculenta]